MSRPVGTELGGQDPYMLLGLRRDASAADIAAARRRALLRDHPDRGGVHDRAAQINAAAALLADPGRRRDYDAQTSASGTSDQYQEPVRQPGTGAPPSSRPGTGPPTASSVPPAGRPRPPRGTGDAHPRAGDTRVTESFPHPTRWRPHRVDTPCAGPRTWSARPRRLTRTSRRRRLRLFLLAAAVILTAAAAIDEVSRHATPAVQLPAAAKPPFWTAVVDSEVESSAAHPQASAFVSALRRKGYVALPVFHSTAYASLRPGYCWVVAVGRFPTSAQAAAAATRLRAHGFEGACVRCVGTLSACAGQGQTR